MMKILCAERDGQWVAHAVREDTGDPFGIECAGDTGQEAIERLTRWLDWQKDHAGALDALQQAERAYHRTVSGSAFTSPTEGPTAVEIQRDALAAVERARIELDAVRARKPEA
jgi:hypothetical protein